MIGMSTRKKTTEEAASRVRLIYIVFIFNSIITSVAFVFYSLNWFSHINNCGSSGTSITYIAVTAAFFYGVIAILAGSVFFFTSTTSVHSKALIAFTVMTFLFTLTMLITMLISLTADFEPSCLSDGNRIEFFYVWLVTGATLLINSLLLLSAILWRNARNKREAPQLPTYESALAFTRSTVMEERERIKLNITGTSSWKLRLQQILRLPATRTIPAIVTSTLLYLIIYNGAVRLWKGEGHPINRFIWRIQKNNGSLNGELLRKEKLVLDYHKSRFYDARDTPPELGY
ncbi:unnamed protein product [Caenorhabditis auriculariae]|uniref:Uncharacterized protein n=1 Tax=Caenorhabditis auriculariae TaxID=2777116 RepID=A0A8S1HVQ0_9PELO|nr:unnamed protein product [Caenorhabditis auriculariae]